MNKKLLAALYLLLWAGIAVGIVYGGTAAGAGMGLMVAVALLVFFLGNGTLAYILKARQLKRQHEQPPRFFQFLFQTDKFNQPANVPAPVRIVLGLIVLLGGMLFALGGVVFMLRLGTIPGVLMGAFSFAMGVAFLYVAYRTLRMRKPEEVVRKTSIAAKVAGGLIALAWAGAAGYASFAPGGFAAGTPMIYKASLLAAGVVAGGALGFITGWLSRYASAVGVTLGQLAVAPPAVQVGMLAAGSVSGPAANVHPLLAIPAFALTLLLVVVLIGALGALIGLAVEVALRAAGRFAGTRVGFRVSWPLARAIVLLAALGGAAFFAADRAGLVPERGAPVSTSQWIEREKALFAEVLGGQRYEILVLPVQVEEKGFDRIARSLMTRYLAKRVADRTGARMPDPSLLARALDARARRVDQAAARKLAEKAGAHTLVETLVRRGAAEFGVESRVWKYEPGAGWRESARAELKSLPFGDRLPPSASLKANVDLLLDQLKFAPAKPAAAPALAQVASGPLQDLRALATQKEAGPEERALRLQVMASLHERESLEAEGLWERSLVALWPAAPSPTVALLEARAYLHLSRRPYALERLGEPATPAAQALQAALNGDVPALEKAIGAINDPALRRMAEIELVDVLGAFHLDRRIAARRASLVSSAPSSLNAALRYRLLASDWFSEQTHREVAGLLQPHVEAEGRIAGLIPWLYWAYWQTDPLGEHSFRLAARIENAWPAAWKSNAAAWSGAEGAERLVERDYYELLFALNRAAALKSVRSMLFMQALPEQAAQVVEALAPSFGGHPLLAYCHAAALERVGRKQPAGKEQPYFSKASALARAVYRWEQGESHLSSSAEQNIFGTGYQRYDDEPLRWYRKREAPPARQYADRITFSKAEMEGHAALARRQLEYADRNSAPLTDLLRWLRRSGQMDAAIAAAQATSGRFVGDGERVALLDELEQILNPAGDTLPLYLQLLELDPGRWDTRWRVALMYLERGAARQAQEAYLAYPPFKRPEPNDLVRLSNIAFEAGYELYRAGETTLAGPLFIVSAQMRTGSAREMRSREMLALGANNMTQAMQIARSEAERYNSSGAAMRHVLYETMLGRHQEAQASLARSLNRFDDEAPWIAAFIAHRMMGLEGPAAEKWLADASAASGRKTYFDGALRERHAFMLGFIGRAPSAEAMENLRRVVKANNGSWFYTTIAEGYAALRQGDYAQAAQKLRRPYNDLFNISVSRREQLTDLLPYMVLAYSRGGQRDEAQALADAYLVQRGLDSDYLIARALLDGADGKHEAALKGLRRAFFRLPPLVTRTFFSGYVLLEACEVLLAESGSEAYRELLEDLARRLQVALPNPWAAAYEAKYARDLDNRQLAIAAATILDARSPLIADVAQAERDKLKGAVARHGSVLGVAARSRPAD